MELKETEKAEIVIREVSKFYSVDKSVMFSMSRRPEIIRKRQICQYLIRDFTNLSDEINGEMTGGKDRTTIIHSHKTINNLLCTEKKLRKEVDSITSLISLSMSNDFCLEDEILRLEAELKYLKEGMHPVMQRVLSLPKNKLEDLIKYKIEPHLKMNA